MFTLDRKASSTSDVIQLENPHIVASVSAGTGFLREISLKDFDDLKVKTDLQFVQYGTRPGKERSGAYLFLPDGEAKVDLFILLQQVILLKIPAFFIAISFLVSRV